MNSLVNLLDSIKMCNKCWLMQDNKSKGIPYVPILPKPDAKVVFIGRDPSPRTAKIVGIKEGRSVFINEIFGILEETGISEDKISITDLCKCHWRTSRGTPLPKTEDRPQEIDNQVAKTCMESWLLKEIQILAPKIIIIFGEELYKLFRPYIKSPKQPPLKLSKTKEKSVMDAEKWIFDNGPFTINIDNKDYPFMALRHPGSSVSLPKNKSEDKRFEYYSNCRQQLINLIKSAKANKSI